MTKMPDYAQKRFLIVDDEPFMLSMIDRMLKQCKAGSITKAFDGAAGLKAVKDNLSQVDCIISDCNMKPVNGLQFLQGIRMGVNPRIPREQPFVMLTGHGDTDVVQTALKLDVSGFVVKPVALDKLVQTIERALERPIDLKSQHYYQAVKLPKMQTVFEGAGVVPIAWVILSHNSPYRTNAGIKAKIEQFKRDHATRDGETEVKLKNRRACDISELTEGLILAQNIEAEEGVTLLRRGVRLSRAVIDRLRAIAVEADANQAVWIADLDE